YCRYSAVLFNPPRTPGSDCAKAGIVKRYNNPVIATAVGVTLRCSRCLDGWPVSATSPRLRTSWPLLKNRCICASSHKDHARLTRRLAAAGSGSVSLRGGIQSRHEAIPKMSENPENVAKNSKTTYVCRGREIQKGEER